jgi:hypothetical protein
MTKIYGRCSVNGSRNAPYGVQMHNGLNLSKSVNDPKSRLARVVNHIRTHGPSRRSDLNKMLGMGIVESPRGWGWYLYVAAIHAGFIVKTRKGRRVFYSLGNNSDFVTTS